MIKNRSFFYSILAAAALLFVVFSVFFYDIVFCGKTMKATTMFAQALPSGPYGQAGNHGLSCHTFLRETAAIEEPFYQFLKTNFSKGDFPLWNPYQCCGVPVTAMMEAGILFPLTALMYWLPDAIGLDAVMLGRMFIAALFMFALMFVWGFSIFACFAAAIVFVLTGPVVTHHLWSFNVDLLLPLLFLGMYKIFHQGNRGHYLFMSAVVFLSMLAGHIEHIFLTHVLLLSYVAFLFFRSPQPYRVRFGILGKIFGFYVLGLGLSAVVFFPFVHDFFQSWTSHTAACGSASVPLRDIISRGITTIVPLFFTDTLVTLDGSAVNWGGGYIGIVALLVILLGLRQGRQRPEVLFSIASVVAALGMMYGLFYMRWIGYLPIFNVMLFGLHILYIIIFLLSILAGAGMEEVLRHPKESLQRILLISASLAIVIICYLWFYRSENFFSGAVVASSVTLSILAIAVAWSIGGIFLCKERPSIIVLGLIGLLIVELFIHNPRCRPNRFDSFPKVPYIEFLKQNTRDPSFRAQGLFLAFYRNTAMAYGVDSFSGSQALYPRRYVEFAQELISPGLFSPICPKPVSTEGFDQALIKNSDILALANVNYFVLPEQSNVGPQPVYDAEVQILPMSSAVPVPSALPRAYLAYQWTVKPRGDHKAIFDIIKNFRLQAAAHVVIENVFNEKLPTSASSRLGIAPVQEKKRWANGVILKAQADQSCVLVLSDTYYPGWKAWIDGKPAKIYPANYLFRAVFLPAGEHEIVFRFIPFWFYAGLGVTMISVMVWIGFFMRRKDPVE